MATGGVNKVDTKEFANISPSNPMLLIDLSKYRLTETMASNVNLKQWTEEVIRSFCPDENKPKLNTPNVVGSLGARHFTAMPNRNEVEDFLKIQQEATNKYSPYWYGMSATCHVSGHIALKLAQMLFPESNWHIIESSMHTFISNVPEAVFRILFDSNGSGPYHKLLNERNAEIWDTFYSKINASMSKKERDNIVRQQYRNINEYQKSLFGPLLIKGDYDKDKPMIFDILITDPDVWTNLVSRSHNFKNTGSNSNSYRKSLLENTNSGLKTMKGGSSRHKRNMIKKRKVHKTRKCIRKIK